MKISDLWANVSRHWNERRADDDPSSTTTGNILIRAGGRKADIINSLKVRDEVFVREQKVPAALEHDGFDEEALHILAFDTTTKEPVGTARVLDKGNGVAKVGRVAVLAAYRGHGVGTAIMQAVLKTTRELEFASLVLDSQVPVIPFYEALGFVAEGEIFPDAGIPHRHMRLSL